MLTTDLVRATVRDGSLVLATLKSAARIEALSLATEYLAVAQSLLGEPRETLLEALKAVDVRMRLERVALGLQKLLLDACEFEPESSIDPPTLRREVFTRAAELRRAAGHLGAFDRDAAVAEASKAHATEAVEIERLLFSDLRGAHRLLRAPHFAPEALVHAYELGQAQAVLLRAERIVVGVSCKSPAAYRALFRRIKFLRLLVTIDVVPSGSYRLTIDGPYSLLASTTKYGLELAMLLPLLRECDSFDLAAVVRWGPTREPVSFQLSGKLSGASIASPALPDELQALVRSFQAKYSNWQVAAADTLVVLPGQSVLVPDLEFTHVETGEIVMLELLGYWSRDAVFRRVELAAAELPVPMIFAVPSRLRVSEEVLPDELPACLCTFKGTLRAAAVHERLESLRSALRAAPTTP